MVEHVLDEVEATDDQRIENTAIFEEMRAERAERRGESRGASHHGELVALLSAETIDRNAVEAMRLEHVERMTEGSERMVASAIRVAEVASKHGGTARCLSREGGGSVFEVEIAD